MQIENKVKARISFLIFFVTCFLPDSSSQKKDFEVPDYDGEKMYYVARIGFINVGKGTISFMSDSLECGSFIKGETKSSGFARIIHRVHYIFECCMEPNTGLPNKSTRYISEGNHHSYNQVTFDRHTRSDSCIVNSDITGIMVTRKNIYDIVTGYYHFRKNFLKQDMIIGQEVVIKTFFADEEFDLRIRYAGKETITTRFGKMKCLKFNPITEVGRYFATENDMSVWITDDELLIPVRIQFNLTVGNLRGDLVRYEAPKQ